MPYPITCRRLACSCLGPAMLMTMSISIAEAQQPGVLLSVAGPDSVTIVPGAHFEAGGLHRFFFGGAYRDLWLTPIRVPVLNLRTFAGGLRPVKEGGGNQTKSLHLVSADGIEYVFRSVDKDKIMVPEMWQGSMVQDIARDAGSNAHPAGAQVAARVLDATDVLHATPVLVAMPDDSLLGKYRKVYAGRLGALEENPSRPKHAEFGFAGAVEILDSDTLLALMNRDPAQHVDSRMFLKARLVDMLVNDWDRGESQWKWARFGPNPMSPWEPIPRDRDKALISFSGLLPTLARSSTVMLIAFGPTMPPVSSLTFTSLLLDQRLLGALERPVWDSIAVALKAQVTDSVIDAAVGTMPAEFRSTGPAMIDKLRKRRDELPATAARFYAFLAEMVDIHGTDIADRATVTRTDDDHVDVRLQSGDGVPYYQRRFDARETREIRVYLHGGNDTAIVRGDVARSIPVRVIGGNGTNTLLDSSRVGGHGETAHLYDVGTVSNVTYGVDTLFNRRPQLIAPGGPVDPIRDYGSQLGPTTGVSINHDYGIMPRFGIERYHYNFDHYPYSSMVALEGRYSLKRSRYKVSLMSDTRLENSPIHFTTLTRMSQLEVMNFFGYGNATVVTSDTTLFAVHQQQWLLQPAIAWSLSATTDLSFGPVIKSFVTDNVPGQFIATEKPYGFGSAGQFGEASLRLSLHHDNRTPKRHAGGGSVLDLGASYFPAMWDVTSGFEELDAAGGAYFTLPVPTHPALALRAGAKKLFGDFPFEEAAFIGGTTTIRTLEPQRFAGDASLYATAELRIPLIHLTLLLPLDLGLLGTVDYGRVFINGDSPGGWHYAAGAGFWVGFHDLTADIRIMHADETGRSVFSLRFVLPTGMSQ